MGKSKFTESKFNKVYEKTGSLTVLQQVMGHADLKTSLTYLRGLEVQHLEVNQLPGF